MKQFATRKEVAGFVLEQRRIGRTIGFVPTMGALHEGHLQLVARSARENDLTVCSIFVNPVQFNNPQDLEKYPRNLAGDAEMLRKEACDVLFAPTTDEIYPDGEPMDPGFDPGVLDRVMEGAFRPGHFRGVALVVRKFLEIVGPDRAYFGKKDYQQLAVVKRLVASLHLPVTVVPCETVREPDGLAMSSRNVRLTVDQRAAAPRIYQVLRSVRAEVGRIPAGELKAWAAMELARDHRIRVEYFEIADRDSLLPIDGMADPQRTVALTAVYLGDVRLIDNLELFC